MGLLQVLQNLGKGEVNRIVSNLSNEANSGANELRTLLGIHPDQGQFISPSPQYDFVKPNQSVGLGINRNKGLVFGNPMGTPQSRFIPQARFSPVKASNNNVDQPILRSAGVTNFPSMNVQLIPSSYPQRSNPVQPNPVQRV